MRSSRMRGYGSWCMGWREGERRSGGGGGDGGGCGTLAAVLFFGLLAFSCFKVAVETGNIMGVVLGLAVIAGVVKSWK